MADGGKCGVNPYQDLFIYYIKGHLNAGTRIAGRHFIGNWQEDDFSFLFFSMAADEAVNKLLGLQPGLNLIDRYRMSYEEWQGGRVEPFRAGRFFVTPPWQPVQDDGPGAGVPGIADLKIILDPGVVFGTGTHPTTRDCLEALERVCGGAIFNRVLDLGTGTGLLALAAAKLGCRSVLAVDFNFLAAKTSALNFQRNGLGHRILALQGLAENFIESPAELVIANIHYDVMQHLVATKGFLQKKYFILSGLLRSQARDLAARLARQPVEIMDQWERDGVWTTFLGRVI